MSQGGAFLIEVVLTAIFVLVVLFATHKAAIQGAAGVAIGFGLVIVHLIGIPLTGTSVNPARSLGPALVVGRHGAQPGLALPRRPAGGRDRGGHHPSGVADRSKDEVVVGRSSTGVPRPLRPLRSGPWI